MSKVTENTNLDTDEDAIDDLTSAIRPRIDILKERARKMGITFSPNIGADTLAKKIADHDVDTQGIVSNMVEEDEAISAQTGKLAKPITARELSIRARKDAQKLIRVNVMPNDPMKAQMLGELIFAGNTQIGTLGKLIPFGTPKGYHIPVMLYKILKEKTFTFFIVKRDNFGNDIVRAVQRPAYNIEVLNPLSEKAIKRIADRQEAQARFEEDEDLNNTEDLDD